MPLIEFKVADLNSVHRGVSLDQLMDGAGREVARFCAKALKGKGGRVFILAGKGNNGGDGFAAAAHLREVASVSVVLAEGVAACDPQGPAARALARILVPGDFEVFEWGPGTRAGVLKRLRESDIVLDCLLGSGISGPARAPYRELIRLAGKARGMLVSVDVPSGFPFAPAVTPAVTLTIEAPKQGMTRANSGRIVPIKIGFPTKAWTHTGPGELQLIPRVPDHAQKTDRGVLAVVGGGPYSGAPALAALAAHAVGAGLVHVFTPSSVANVVRRYDPSLIVHPLLGDALGPEHAGDILSMASRFKCTAMAIGPGLGRSAGTRKAVQAIVGRWRGTAVIDADAIRAAADLKGKLGKALLTPHSGEFRGLTGRSPGEPTDLKARTRAAKQAAKSLRTTVLLKGHVTVITDGKRTKLNDAGVSAMAVGGTGDVLTGIVGSLLSKGLSPYDAGRVGAFIAGAAGEVAFSEMGHSLKPTDLIASIPRVMARHLDWWGGKP